MQDDEFAYLLVAHDAGTLAHELASLQRSAPVNPYRDDALYGWAWTLGFRLRVHLKGGPCG